jgi:hypothetical protein
MKSDDVLLEQQCLAYRHSSWLAHKAIAGILLAVGPTVRGRLRAASGVLRRCSGPWESKTTLAAKADLGPAPSG